MKKVRVCKDMPGCTVGDIFTPEADCKFINALVEKMIEKGFLEWVEERKSLEEKFWEYEQKSRCNMRDECKNLAQIAKEHYLAVFDKAEKSYNGCTHGDYKKYWMEHIRKALEEA